MLSGLPHCGTNVEKSVTRIHYNAVKGKGQSRTKITGIYAGCIVCKYKQIEVRSNLLQARFGG